MKYYFCGIGGIGMSSIAQYLKLKNNEVAGSDRAFDLNDNQAMREKLCQMGIQIYPQDGSGVNKDIDCFVTSTAVESQIPDVQKALELHIPIKRRAEMLAEILHSYTGIAVAGTSGKTTITAMIGHILYNANLSPVVINGGISVNCYHDQPCSNLQLGDGKFCVIEADESDGTIELYSPAISVVSNISLDHKPIAELLPLFEGLLKRTTKGAVINLDCPYTAKFAKTNPHTMTFSHTQKADLMATNIVSTLAGVRFKVNGIDAFLPTFGVHNVENALAAIGAAYLAGVSIETSIEALASFAGTKRRLEKIGQARDIVVYDDYAHNPEKIAAALNSLSDGTHPLWCIFQPHGFAPTRLMKDAYIESFIKHTHACDTILLPEIFYQGGTVAKDISSADLAKALQEAGKHAYFFKNRDEIPAFIATRIKSISRIVVMGARDNTLTQLAQQILSQIKG